MADEKDKHYQEGLASGLLLAPRLRQIIPQGSTPTGPEAIHHEAQDKQVSEGKKLAAEEKAKREKHPLDRWDEFLKRAEAGEFPKGTDIFCTKFFGLFYVAPAQNSYMCRLRLPNGIINTYQFRGIADLAEKYGGGYSHVTTRANLQIREINATNGPKVLLGLYDLGIINRGAGADNIRNITGSPTAGIDPQELIDTRPLAREMHYYILNHRELYGLPRKFNIGFDGGGSISVLEDTNDIGFSAVQVPEGKSAPAGIYFRLQLGGITGHKQFAHDTGVILTPEQCISVAAAILRVFIETGDRSDRTKARLKYVLDQWGVEKYLKEVQKHLPFDLIYLPPEDYIQPLPSRRDVHIGFHEQKQEGLYYVGVVLSVGKLTTSQMQGLANIADEFGSGTIRLTVWQNLLISDIPEHHIESVKERLEELDLGWSTNSIRAGLVACTGNTGCKFSASDTKRHALDIVEYVEQHITLDCPINIHLTGCLHSCAQHFIGDIGLLGCKISSDDEEEIEGYHIYVGGGFGTNQKLAVELQRNVPSHSVPQFIEALLRAYLDHRSLGENFGVFSQRHPKDELLALMKNNGYQLNS